VARRSRWVTGFKETLPAVGAKVRQISRHSFAERELRGRFTDRTRELEAVPGARAHQYDLRHSLHRVDDEIEAAVRKAQAEQTD